jgi:beta-glucanase (GH16 family)
MYHYTSGWVDANFLFGQLHGRWEIKAKLPNPRRIAIWPAIWLMNCGFSPLASPQHPHAQPRPDKSKPNSCSG